MKRSIVIPALIAMMLAPCAPLTGDVAAKSPTVVVAGDYGFFGIDPEGGVHYVLTSDGLRYYDIPSYGYCGHHHCHHKCRYVAPGHRKPGKACKKHHKQLKKQGHKKHKEHRPHKQHNHRRGPEPR